MQCPNCGVELTGSEAFCTSCGTPLSTAPVEGAGTGIPMAQTQPVQTQPMDYQAQQSAYGEAQPNPYANAASSQTTPMPPAGAGGQQSSYQSYPYQPQPQPPANQASSAPFVLAIIALVTAILGLFPISLILAIIALVMNSGQKKRGETSTKQTPTFVMSLISLILSVVVLIATVVMGGLIWQAILNGDIDVTTTTPSSQAATSSSAAATSSISSSSAATSSSSSAASSSAASSASASSSGVPSFGADVTNDYTFSDFYSITPVVLADDSMVKIEAIGLGECYGDWGLVLKTTNKLSEEIIIFDDDDFKINGVDPSAIAAEHVLAGETAICTVEFWGDDFETLDSVRGTITGTLLVDNADYDDLESIPVSLTI